MADEEPHEKSDQRWYVSDRVVGVDAPRQPAVMQHEVLQRQLGRHVEDVLQPVDLAGTVDRACGLRQRQHTRQAPHRVQSSHQRQLLRCPHRYGA